MTTLTITTGAQTDTGRRRTMNEDSLLAAYPVFIVADGMGGHDAGDTVVMVTHGGILQHILAVLLGTDRTWGTTVHNTGVFDFSIDKERWPLDGEHRLVGTYFRINRFNDASHLQ